MQNSKDITSSENTAFTLSLGDSELKIFVSSIHEIRLPLGIQSLSDKFFKHMHPTDLELEYAIADIEDQVMPVDPQLPEKRGILKIKTESIENISPNIPMSLDEYERVFNTSLKNGKKHDIAALLIIRECLHHLRFSGVVFH